MGLDARHLLWNEPLEVHLYSVANLSAYLPHPSPEFLGQVSELSLLEGGRLRKQHFIKRNPLAPYIYKDFDRGHESV